MRTSLAALAALAAALAAPSTKAFSRPAAATPPRSRSAAQRARRAVFRPRGRTGPAREDRSPAGLARIAAAEAKRACRRSRNIDQALRGGWGADAREATLRHLAVF